MIMMIEGRMIGGFNVRTLRGRYWVYLCKYSSFRLAGENNCCTAKDGLHLSSDFDWPVKRTETFELHQA